MFLGVWEKAVIEKKSLLVNIFRIVDNNQSKKESEILIVTISALETAETSTSLAALAGVLLEGLSGGFLGDIDGLAHIDLLEHGDCHLVGHLE